MDLDVEKVLVWVTLQPPTYCVPEYCKVNCNSFLYCIVTIKKNQIDGPCFSENVN